MAEAENPTPALDLTEIRRRWLDACADADVVAGKEAHIAPIPGRPPQNANFAMHYDPGSAIYPDNRFPLSTAQRKKFNSAELRDTHRIAVYTEVEPRVLSGLFRHELQHARQFRSQREAYRATSHANVALYTAYGSRPGSGVLYNASPLEQDANAAASKFLRKLDGEPTAAEVDGTQAQLFRQADLPWGEKDLSTETLAFLALHPNELEQVVPPRHVDVAALIAPLHPNAAELWQRLGNDSVLRAMRASFRDVIPTDDGIAAASERPGDAWQPLSKALVAARDRARAVIQGAS